MLSLLMLAAAVGWVALWFYVFKYAPNRGVRVGAVLAALLIPFWDLPYGLFNFWWHCSREGGTHIEKAIPSAATILIDEALGYRPEDVLKFGYRAVEYKSSGKFIRLESDGKDLRRSEGPASRSQFKLQFSGHQILPWHLVRSESSISNANTGEIIARQTDFRWQGVWWQVAMAPLLGSGFYCLPPDTQPLLEQVRVAR